MFQEGGLHRMQAGWRPQTFDGCDGLALVHDRKRQARVDAATIDQHGASTALAVVAALLGASEPKVLTQGVEQRSARVEFQGMGLAVDAERHSFDGGVLGFLLRPRYQWCRGCRYSELQDVAS